jgi:Uma2 family endonuclease
MPMALDPGSPAPRLYYSADMVRDLPDDGNRYETVFGELLVTPAPRAWHQEIVARLSDELRAYLRTERVGHAMMSPADISWGADTLVQPDLFVVPLEQARTLDWTRMRDLLLVAEVLSPNTARADRFAKRRLYQEQGVQLYWVVDGDERLVEVWTPESQFPTMERRRLVWEPAGAARPFSLELGELFRPI